MQFSSFSSTSLEIFESEESNQSAIVSLYIHIIKIGHQVRVLKKGLASLPIPLSNSLSTYKLSIAFCTAGPIWRLREVTPSRVNMSLVGSALKADLMT